MKFEKFLRTLFFTERLRWLLLHLREHKFKHSFKDCLDPLCFCGNDIETSTHYLLHCSIHTNKRMTLLDKIKSINCGILELSGVVMTKVLLCGTLLVLLLIPLF